MDFALEIPDPFDEFPVPLFRAARGHVGAGVVEIAVEKDALTDSAEAAPAREIQVDHGVGSGEAGWEGSVVVAVHDPLVLCDELGDFLIELIVGHGGPVGPPVFIVEVDDRQMEDGAHLAGEGGFSCAGAANDEDALHVWRITHVMDEFIEVNVPKCHRMRKNPGRRLKLRTRRGGMVAFDYVL